MILRTEKQVLLLGGSEGNQLFPGTSCMALQPSPPSKGLFEALSLGHAMPLSTSFSTGCSPVQPTYLCNKQLEKYLYESYVQAAPSSTKRAKTRSLCKVLLCERHFSFLLRSIEF